MSITVANNNKTITFQLKELQQGSEQAFSKIYDHFSPQLYQTIIYFVKDDAIADEILQDLFMHVWNKRELIDPSKTFWPYLRIVANWYIHRYYRKVASDRKLINELMISTVDYVLNAEDIMIHAENHALLAKAIESLPPKRREVFKLCKLEGKSYQEVAEIMDISIATINNQIVEANKSVKQFFLLHNELTVILIISFGTALLNHSLTTSL